MNILHLTLLLFQIKPTFACAPTENTASSPAISCDDVTVLPITNPTNFDTTPQISYAGSTATILCASDVTGATITSVVLYNTDVNSGLSTITLTCVSGTWSYTPTGGTETAIENVQCLTTI